MNSGVCHTSRLQILQVEIQCNPEHTPPAKYTIASKNVEVRVKAVREIAECLHGDHAARNGVGFGNRALEKGLFVNPPPSDGRCMCCGRHLIELTPFGGPGDPLVDDVSGALLIKKDRWSAPNDEEAKSAVEEADRCHEADGYDGPLEWMKAKYGKEKGEQLFSAFCALFSTEESWECRDCAILDAGEYLERIWSRYQEEQKQERAARLPEEPDPH